MPNTDKHKYASTSDNDNKKELRKNVAALIAELGKNNPLSKILEEFAKAYDKGDFKTADNLLNEFIKTSASQGFGLRHYEENKPGYELNKKKTEEYLKVIDENRKKYGLKPYQPEPYSLPESLNKASLNQTIKADALRMSHPDPEVILQVYKRKDAERKAYQKYIEKNPQIAVQQNISRSYESYDSLATLTERDKFFSGLAFSLIGGQIGKKIGGNIGELGEKLIGTAAGGSLNQIYNHFRRLSPEEMQMLQLESDIASSRFMLERMRDNKLDMDLLNLELGVMNNTLPQNHMFGGNALRIIESHRAPTHYKSTELRMWESANFGQNVSFIPYAGTALAFMVGGQHFRENRNPTLNLGAPYVGPIISTPEAARELNRLGLEGNERGAYLAYQREREKQLEIFYNRNPEAAAQRDAMIETLFKSSKNKSTWEEINAAWYAERDSLIKVAHEEWLLKQAGNGSKLIENTDNTLPGAPEMSGEVIGGGQQQVPFYNMNVSNYEGPKYYYYNSDYMNRQDSVPQYNNMLPVLMELFGEQ